MKQLIWRLHVRKRFKDIEPFHFDSLNLYNEFISLFYGHHFLQLEHISPSNFHIEFH